MRAWGKHVFDLKSGWGKPIFPERASKGNN